MDNIWPILIGLLMTVGGPVIAFSSYKKTYIAKVAEQWPTALGKITKSEIVEIGPNPKTHTCNIVYEYNIGNGDIESDRVSFFGIFTLKESEEFTNRFRVGTRHPVYYDPSNPELSVLVPGIYGKNRTHGATMGVIVALAGIAVLIGAT